MSVEGVEGDVEVGGVLVRALVAVEGARPGDVVLVHAGVVIEKLDREGVLANLAVYYDLVKYHYVFNGASEEEASRRAREDLASLARSLGIPEGEVLRALSEEPGGAAGGGPAEVEVPEKAFYIDYSVQLAETDYLQVVHYTNYLRICERAFMSALSSAGMSYGKLIHEYGIFIPTVEVSARIRSPSRLDNSLRVYVWVEEIGRKHLKYRCVVHNKTTGRVVADVTHVAVCTDTAITASHEIPKEVRQALEKLTSSYRSPNSTA